MNRGQRVGTQYLLALLGLLIVIVAGGGLYFFTEFRIDYSAIDHIKNLQKAPNNFMDLAGDIKVEGPDDIGFIVKGKYNLIIYYGQQRIKMTPACFKSDEYKQRLADIGVVVYTHVNDDDTVQYKVTYWGEDVDQYSLAN